MTKSTLAAALRATQETLAHFVPSDFVSESKAISFSRLIAERDELELLVNAIQEEWDGILVDRCCYCKRIFGARDACGAMGGTSHGVCPTCDERRVWDA